MASSRTPAEKEAQKRYMQKFKRMEILVTDEEKAILEAAATAQGKSVRAFVHDSAMIAADADSHEAGKEAITAQV